MIIKNIITIFLSAVLSAITIPLLAVHSQESPEPQDGVINYAYSSWIGSGFYTVGDRTVYTLRGPFSYALRKAGSKKWGLELLGDM